MPRRLPRRRASLARAGKAVPSAERQRRLHGLMIEAVVERHPERIDIGQRSRRDQVLAAQREPIEAELLAGEIDQPLHHEHGFRAPGGPIGPRGHGVGQHRAGAKARRRHVIDAGHHLDALLQRRERHRVGADIRRVGAAHGEEPSIRVQGQLGLEREIASLIVGEERLVTLAGPFDRPPEPPRRPGDQREFGKEAAARSIVAADVVHHHPHALGRHVEHPGEIVLLAHRRAAAGVERGAAARGIIGGDRRPRLHRHAGHALHQRCELHHVGRVGERRLGPGRIADDGIDAEVRRGAVPYLGRSRGSGRGRIGHRRQRLVVDRDALGGVLGGRDRGGDHHRDRFADEPRLVARQRPMRRDECGRAVLIVQHDLGRMGRERRVRDGLEAVGQRSCPVNTASTPGAARAFAVSIARMRACACGERSMTA